MHNTEIPHKDKSLSLFYVSAYFLNENFDDLQSLLSWAKIFFDIIETRITKEVFLLTH